MHINVYVCQFTLTFSIYNGRQAIASDGDMKPQRKNNKHKLTQTQNTKKVQIWDSKMTTRKWNKKKTIQRQRIRRMTVIDVRTYVSDGWSFFFLFSSIAPEANAYCTSLTPAYLSNTLNSTWRILMCLCLWIFAGAHHPIYNWKEWVWDLLWRCFAN